MDSLAQYEMKKEIVEFVHDSIMSEFSDIEQSNTDKSGINTPEPRVYFELNDGAWWTEGDAEETDKEDYCDMCFDFSDLENEDRLLSEIESFAEDRVYAIINDL